jgi:methyl-accepting chemotaxis protein
VGEVAAASSEQAQGIDQVNKAVAEMDKVVQQNAANAEESAAASEELNAQAEQMKSYVQDLVSVIGGSEKKGAGSRFLSRGRRKEKKKDVASDSFGPEMNALTTKRKGGGRAPGLPKANKMLPDRIIPFDEELTDF